MQIKILYAIIMAFCVTMVSYAQGDIKWDYPIKPGTEEWKKMKTHVEKLSVCQIPDDILKKMSTRELVNVSLKYPLTVDLLVYSSIYDGVKKNITNFNGFMEILSRKDNCNALFDMMFERMSELTDFSALTDTIQIGENMVLLSLIETFLSFDEVQINADNNLKRKIAVVEYNILKEKEQNVDYYDLTTLSTSCNLFCKVMTELFKEKRILVETRLDNKTLYSRDEVKFILNLFNNEIKTLL